MKVRYMQGGDHDEEDEYVFTVKSATQPRNVEVIVGGGVVKMVIDLYTNPMEWAKAAEDCLCIQEVWQEALRLRKQGAAK